MVSLILILHTLVLKASRWICTWRDEKMVKELALTKFWSVYLEVPMAKSNQIFCIDSTNKIWFIYFKNGWVQRNMLWISWTKVSLMNISFMNLCLYLQIDLLRYTFKGWQIGQPYVRLHCFYKNAMVVRSSGQPHVYLLETVHKYMFYTPIPSTSTYTGVQSIFNFVEMNFVAGLHTFQFSYKKFYG